MDKDMDKHSRAPLLVQVDDSDRYYNDDRTSGGTASRVKSTGLPVAEHWRMVTALVVLTVLDTVFGVVLFFTFTETYSNYLNQATGTVYIVVSTIQRMCQTYCFRSKENSKDQLHLLESVEPQKPATPMWILLVIGFINGTGNFFQSIGQTHTAGSTQALLSLFGIPLVMLMSWVWLHKQPNLIALGGALCIIVSTILTSLDSLRASSEPSGVTIIWYSTLIFVVGQVFFALEKVVEEVAFNKYHKLDVIVMFQWAMIVQTILYFAYYPIQTVGSFGDLNMTDIPSVLRDGILCTAGHDAISHDTNRPECDWKSPFLFFSYCAIDYCCYGMQLYVIQKGGANLVVLATALSLPITNFAYLLPLPFDGFHAKFQWYNLVALIFAVFGYYIYEFHGDTKIKRR